MRLRKGGWPTKVSMRKAGSNPGEYHDRAPLVTRKDLAVLAKLPLSGFISWILSERHWEGLAWRAASLERHALDKTARRIANVMEPRRLKAPAADIARRQRAMIRLDQLCFLRSYRPGGWRPHLSLQGCEHLDLALKDGRGAILWVAPMVFQWLPTKRTMSEAGYRVHHLSSPQHGFSSSSRFGVGCLNSIRTTVEDRYLAARVMLGPNGQAQGALRRLAALLSQNHVVSITFGSAGAKAASALLLDGVVQAATGAPHLAIRTGAALLPVFTIRTGHGRFLTTIGAPLRVPESVGHDRGHHLVVAEFARSFEPHILNHPDQVVWGLSCFDRRSDGMANG